MAGLGDSSMTRWAVAVVLALLAGESHAGVLHCNFTEPFFTITFDSSTGKVIWLSHDVSDPDTGKPIPQTLAEGARLRLVNPDGDGRTFRVETDTSHILQLRLTGQGSDGMSENIFPFEANYGGWVGGCATEKYPAFDTYEIVNDLGWKY
jgi:uncharacterized membrane protein